MLEEFFGSSQEMSFRMLIKNVLITLIQGH